MKHLILSALLVSGLAGASAQRAFAQVDTTITTVTTTTTTSKGKNYNMDIFWMPMTQRSKNTDTTRNRDIPDGFDVDRYYAVNTTGDTMLIQEFAFGKIFRKAYEFYQADRTAEAGSDDKTIAK